MSLADAVTEAKRIAEQNRQAGMNQTALGLAGQEGFALGAFEDTEDEILAVVEEFHPEEFEPIQGKTQDDDEGLKQRQPIQRLAEKLQSKADAMGA